MSKSWERLTKRKEWSAIGFVRSVEVTRSEDGKAHPHYHCLLMVPSSYFGGNGYITQAKWTELWKSCLKVDYTPIVDVRAVKPKKVTDINSDTNSGLYQAICETLKYSVKEADLVADADWLHELTRQLHKTRAIALGGMIREFLSEEDPEDLINSGLEDEPTEAEDPTLSFGWRETLKRYGKNKNC
jgi:plasmid rolling circle replication initiator protein Rep